MTQPADSPSPRKLKWRPGMPEYDIETLEIELATVRAELDRLQAENICDACAGTGMPTSGLPCMCGGTGRMSDAATYLREELTRLRAAQQEMEQDIKLFWDFVEMAWDIETREYFEKEARTNGFVSPLAQAAHHMWKRDTNVSSLTSQVQQLEQELRDKCEEDLGVDLTAEQAGQMGIPGPNPRVSVAWCLSTVFAQAETIQKLDAIARQWEEFGRECQGAQNPVAERRDELERRVFAAQARIAVWENGPDYMLSTEASQLLRAILSGETK